MTWTQRKIIQTHNAVISINPNDPLQETVMLQVPICLADHEEWESLKADRIRIAKCEIQVKAPFNTRSPSDGQKIPYHVHFYQGDTKYDNPTKFNDILKRGEHYKIDDVTTINYNAPEGTCWRIVTGSGTVNKFQQSDEIKKGEAIEYTTVYDENHEYQMFMVTLAMRASDFFTTPVGQKRLKFAPEDIKSKLGYVADSSAPSTLRKKGVKQNPPVNPVGEEFSVSVTIDQIFTLYYTI